MRRDRSVEEHMDVDEKQLQGQQEEQLQGQEKQEDDAEEQD